MQLVPSLDRLGTETAFQVLARAEALQRSGHDIINLGIGQPDFKTASHIVEAAVRALHDGHHGFPPGMMTTLPASTDVLWRCSRSAATASR
ncbi:MAG: hypothetical protein AAFR60_07955, partial [Pseudomonadota bacterium]